jgi:LysR family hydrogen peroxide-inducible transcriptional activator
MTLTELRYVIMLAQEKHFRRAAERCFVSQPTLSVAIKKLEDELEVALFERDSNEVRLTAIGERVVAQARRVLEETDVIKTIAREGKSQVNAPLKVGAIFTIGPYLFPHLIRNIRTIAPKMPLLLEENYTAVLRQKLRQGDLDAIIISLPFSEPDTEVHDLYDEPFHVLIPAHHPLANENKITRKQLESETVLLLGDGHCFRDQVLNACPNLIQQANQSREMLPQGTSLETLRHMVASGLGLTIVPATSATSRVYDTDTIREIPFAGKVPTRRVTLVWRSRFSRPKAIEVLIEAISCCRLDGIEAA